MADLNDKIAALEAEIEGYKAKLENCSPDKVDTWAGLISFRSTTLTALINQQQSAAGKHPSSTCFLPPHFTPSLISFSCSTLTPFCLFSASPSMSLLCFIRFYLFM